MSRFVSDSSIVDSFGQYEASTYAHIDATFVNGEPADVSVAKVDWLSLVSLRFSVFASRITQDTKLAWAASRLWAVCQPMLQCLLQDTAQDGIIDTLTVAEFNRVEE